MNKVDTYWQAFCAQQGLKDVQYKEAFQFGVEPDWLASLVVDGSKTATCSSYPLYALEQEPLPAVGQYNIILNSADEPVAIIRIEDVQIVPFQDVPVEFALAEGEGTYEQWKEAHIAFFSATLPAYGLAFTDDMLTVCERFTKVFPK